MAALILLTLGLVAALSFATGNGASIGNLVWSDRDGDGTVDAGEPGLSGISVTLVEAGADGVLGTGDDTSFPNQTTDANGAYSFTQLAAGKFRVDVQQSGAPGHFVTSGNDPLTIDLAGSQAYADADFGLARPEWITLNVDPAAITTLAGNGANSNFDGTGSGASFRNPAGIVVVDNYAYVAAEVAIRRVDLSTGAVRPVFRAGDDYFAIDATRLPPRSVVSDGIPGSVDKPPGPVSVYNPDVDLLKAAELRELRGTFPK